MKPIIFVFISSLLLSACNKTQFKETKIEPEMSNPMANQAVASPGMKNEELPPGHPSTNSELPPGHPQVGGKNNPGSESEAVKVEKLDKAPGGMTVAECFKKDQKLKGTKVIVRGKVVKYTPGIMGKNWLHLRDGSGTKETNDIVVTTTEKAKVKDTVVVNGTLEYDRDIGSGYFFPAIIENASLKVE